MILIPGCFQSQTGEGRKGQKEIHSLLEITDEERGKIPYNKKSLKKLYGVTQATHQKPLRYTIDYRVDQFTLSKIEIHSNACHERHLTFFELFLFVLSTLTITLAQNIYY